MLSTSIRKVCPISNCWAALFCWGGSLKPPFQLHIFMETKDWNFLPRIMDKILPKKCIHNFTLQSFFELGNGVKSHENPYLYDTCIYIGTKIKPYTYYIIKCTPGANPTYEFWIYKSNASVYVGYSVFHCKRKHFFFQNSWRCIFYNAGIVTHSRTYVCRIGSRCQRKAKKSTPCVRLASCQKIGYADASQ
jgi:hypothetical protein